MPLDLKKGFFRSNQRNCAIQNFLLGRGGKGVYTTFSKDYTINLNNFREYFQEQLSL